MSLPLTNGHINGDLDKNIKKLYIKAENESQISDEEMAVNKISSSYLNLINAIEGEVNI